MPTIKLVCPHCGHDGTQETSRPPLGSFGFNYLAEGLVCREVYGYDETGRLRLSGDFKCESSQVTNARLECRSCWRTFPLPESLTHGTTEEAGIPAADILVTPPEPQTTPVGLESAADAIGRNLLGVLRAMDEELARSGAARMNELESAVAGLNELVQALSQAGEQNAERVAQQAQAIAGLAEQHSQVREEGARQASAAADRLAAVESALEEAREASARAGEALRELQESQQSCRQRLDAQADVIRALHATAQEQASRKEELRQAVQRLEQLAGALEQVKPLPEGL